MNYETLKREVDKTKEVLPSTITTEKLNIYWDEFQSWPDEVFMDAMAICRRELDWFPTINQIRQRRFSFASVKPRPTSEDTYECSHCRDKGDVEVYHPLGYQPIRDGEFSITKHLRTVVVACDCARGEARSRPLSIEEKRAGKCRPLITFDAAVMKKVIERMPTAQVHELEEFVLNEWQSSSQRAEWIP